MLDVVIRNGIVYDGTGSPGRRADVGMRAGRITQVAQEILEPAAREVDAEGCWVMPGFIDLHTHYDAEIEVAPSLSESVRHGVTTVVVGSCSLSFAVGEPEDLADMYCRVEAIPRQVVLPILKERKDW